MKKDAEEIFQTYLASNAPSLVNVDQSGIESVEKKLNSPDRRMFESPQNQVRMDASL